MAAGFSRRIDFERGLKGVLIVKDHGGFDGIMTAVHELGHL